MVDTLYLPRYEREKKEGKEMEKREGGRSHEKYSKSM